MSIFGLYMEHVQKHTHTHLQAVQPVPAIGSITDVEELQNTDEHVGVVVRQRASQ